MSPASDVIRVPGRTPIRAFLKMRRRRKKKTTTTRGQMKEKKMPMRNLKNEEK